MSNQNEEKELSAEQIDKETLAEEIGETTTHMAAESSLKDLEKDLDEAKQKAEENWNLFLRTRADMDNLRRRIEIDLDKERKYGIERFARELIVVLDSLEQGISVAESAEDAAYREGMGLTLKLFLDVFEKFGITRIQPAVGEPLDPTKHEAISLQEDAAAKPNSILVTAQPGFLLQDRVLRPARVVVAKAPAA